MKKAIVLLSGGLDSTTCLAIAKSQGYACYALSFDYGQRHNAELEAAKRVARQLGAIEHHVFTLDIGQFKGSALTDASVAVPDYCGDGKIPVTYVPARNTIFLSVALGFAETLAAFNLFIGVSQIDYSGYPDCRPEYIAAFETMANLATKAGIEGRKTVIHTPLIAWSKAETIRQGVACGADYSLTVSCYQATPEGVACGRCDSCTYRRKGFNEAGIIDPTRYVSG
ncbi:7-cyano-7-deazaguanine synthase QueC [Legionella taurinensis]|uniref:7-cyano-7-deazaguanine synthase n=1 Tax=Legionella taurinensis TaxID=70611 RepID=A0A3A5L9B3_9GAMM|nr:7-cyano-7-deazaguanine synthase QueC [Legionella taurinensis]MDX1836119.1 7-cyano-7-deazaguanine synthase QueC [Legionella taurinensis]PUT42107.1 7-cyano-7-deazaguanine synthase QueC [Legionella taurinensis]PUT44894.1 7-cyano-7-deazaguanine synthase QueC [Legionella taurinensis]PUT48215.1 7-cyano-7-deazaguanine synthase QueC [Legionella taurinensis]PUT49029.1 7-cyano-7-deazaguanine synthase QueC [Legionella taurinensis]